MKKVYESFDPRIKQPLDRRTRVNNLNEIDRPYEGLMTYQKSDKKMYIYDENGSFIPLLSGSIYINVQIAPLNLLSAKGDGINDDTLAIQGILDYVNSLGGGVVFLPRGTYKITDTLKVYSNTTLLGAGRGATTIDGRGLNSEFTNQKTFILASGSVGSNILLSTSSNELDLSVNVTSSAGLSVDDWVQLGSDGILHTWSTSYSANIGEIKRIRVINNNNITFEDGLFNNYTIGQNAFLRKIDFCKNVVFKDFTLLGTDMSNGESGIKLNFCSNALVENVEFKYIDFYQCAVNNSIYTKVLNNHFHGVYYNQTDGLLFYGCCVMNSSQWITVANNSAVECRHLFVCTANSVGQNEYGQPMFVNVMGNVANQCNLSYAYEHHGFGKHINIIGNTANNCYAGASIEGDNVIVANNNFYNITNTGVLLQLGSSVNNIIIEGNIIDKVNGNGINVSAYANFPMDKIMIKNNIINSISSANGINVTAHASNVQISGNFLKGIGGALGHGIRNDSVGAIITGNKVTNYAGLIYNTGTDTVIAENVLDNNTGTNSLTNIANECNIVGNRFKNVLAGTSPISLGTSSNCVVMSNNLKNSANGINVGTGTGNILSTADNAGKYNRD